MKILFLVFSFLFLSSCSKPDIIIVVPNEYHGTFYINEKWKNYDLPYGPALENFCVYEYTVGDDNVLNVKNISIFKNNPNINFGYEWAAPVREKVTLSWISNSKIEVKVE